ncbi:DUF4439 domain-containing protein [Sinomonas notoginsengisoli]
MNPATPHRLRPWIWAGALGVAAAIGIGASLLAAPAPPAAGPTLSEAALSRAHDDAAHLAAAASLLAGSSPSSGPSPSPDVVPAARVATVLQLQADVLGASLPPSAATSASGGSLRPSSPESLSPRSRTSSAATPPLHDAAALAEDLSASAAARRADLAAVDGPTAALLASVAVGQTIEAERLAALAGTAGSGGPSAAPAPTTPAPAATTTSSPSQRACASPPATRTARGTPAGRAPSSAPTAPPAQPPTSENAAGPSPGALDEATALAAVQTAEQAGVWTYTVRAARTAVDGRTLNLAAAGLHRSQLRALETVARAACVELPPEQAGFALPGDVGGEAQLVQLEGSAAAAWSDLTGAADPPLRATAASALLEAARRIAVVDAPGTAAASAFPGNARAQAAALKAAQSGVSASPKG